MKESIRSPGTVAWDVVACIAIVALALAIGLPRYLAGIGLGDQGFLAFGGLRTLRGDVPNLDFVSLQPPLSFYVLAGLFKLFGPSLEVVRTLGLALSVTIPLIAYGLSRRISGIVPSLVAPLCMIVMGMPLYNFTPFAVWWGIGFSLLAAVFTLSSVQTQRRGLALGAGVATWLALISRHDQGVYLTIAICIYWGLLFVSGSRDATSRTSTQRLALGWLIGFATCAVLSLALWFFQGAIPAMFEQLIVFPLTRYAETSSLPWPTFNLTQGLEKNGVTALYYLPIAVALPGVALMAVRIKLKRFEAKDADASFVMILALLFYSQVFARSDIYHLIVTLPPTFVGLGWWLQQGLSAISVRQSDWVTGTPKDARLGAIAAAALSMIFVFHTCGDQFLKRIPNTLRPLELDRGHLKLPPAMAKQIEENVHFIRANAGPEQSILVLPYAPMYYFLADRRNPTRWNYIWPGDQTAEEHLELIAQAKSDPPAVALITNPTRLRRSAQPIDQYLEEDFDLAAELRGTHMFLPKPKVP